MKAFISYSHRDEPMLDRLHTHLAMLQREKAVTTWHDREITAGAVLNRAITQELESSQLFLPLVSPDFLASNYCYEKEMEKAIELHDAGRLRILPIILEPCDWLASPLKAFKAVPKDGKPVSEWTNKNTAWLDVVTELRRAIQSSTTQSSDGDRDSGRSGPGRAQPAASGRYRVKRTFDTVDRDDYRRAAFNTVRTFFEKSCQEMDGVDGLRARYESMGPTAFSCTVVNRNIKAGRGSGTAYITVRSGGNAILGDISWSFSARAADNTANGGFSVEADDYRLYLHANFFSQSDERRAWSPEEAASRLWQDFTERAGISHD